MPQTIITAELPMRYDNPEPVKPVVDLRNVRDLHFENGHTHYVHPSVLRALSQLTIRGLEDAEIFLLDELEGEAVYLDSYRDDCGVLNLLDCKNVRLRGDIINLRRFVAGNIVSESSCALNIARSRRITVSQSTLISRGKCCLSVHSGSEVFLEDVEISGYYFELICGGSVVTGLRMKFYQTHPDGDSHAAIWTGHSAKSQPGGVVHKNCNLLFSDTTFYMNTGRSIVCGNGAYDARSFLELRDCEIHNADPLFGFQPCHENYAGVTVLTDVEPDGIVNLAGPSNSGFGRFVNYYGQLTKPNSQAPCIVNGVSTEEL